MVRNVGRTGRAVPGPAAGSPAFADLPLRMRQHVTVVIGIAAAGLLVEAVLIGGDAIAAALREPQLWLLLGLILVADLYPLAPWQRDIKGRIRIHWSGAFSLAMFLAFGPATVVLFPLIGLAATSSLPSTFWRRTFNVSVVTCEAVAGVLTASLLAPPWTPEPSVGYLMGVGALVALTWEVVNLLVICPALVMVEDRPWRASVRVGIRRTWVWLAALVTAPMIAELVMVAPAMVPGLAVVMIAVHHSTASLTRRRDEARTDQLTGLANRAAMLEWLDRNLSAVDRRAETITLLVIDLDGFKAVNDTHGHDVGDQVLAVVAGNIRRAIGPELFVARLGGDEFVVGARGDADGAVLADTVAAAVRQPLPDYAEGVRLSCSIGWSSARSPAVPMEVFRSADRALYSAKATRRTS